MPPTTTDAVAVVPGAEAMRYASDRTKVKFTMLQAAVAVVSGGAEQLKTIKDPFGDGPLEYRPFEGGFELQSKLQGKDRGLGTLRVGWHNGG